MGLTKMKSDRCTLESNIVSIVKIKANFSVSLNSGPNIYRTQFPLMLTFAWTVY